MNPNPQHHPHDHDAELDRLLLTHLSSSSNSPAHLIPSSGFANSVMDAVHQQTTAPPPIPFPWKRLLPCAIALACVLLAFFLLPRQTTSLTQGVPFQLALSQTTIMTVSLVAASIAISITITAVSFKLLAGYRR